MSSFSAVSKRIFASKYSFEEGTPILSKKRTWGKQRRKWLQLLTSLCNLRSYTSPACKFPIFAAVLRFTLVAYQLFWESIFNMCRSSTLAEEKRWELLRDDRSESSLRDDRTAHRLCQAMQGPFELVCTRGNVVWKVCATSVTMYIVDIVALFCTKVVKSVSSLRRPNHLRSTIIVFSSKKFSQLWRK